MVEGEKLGVERKRELDSQRSWFNQVLAQLQYRGFHGTLTIKVEQGVIRRVEKMESLLPPD